MSNVLTCRLYGHVDGIIITTEDFLNQRSDLVDNHPVLFGGE